MKRIVPIVALCFCLASCSTTRVLEEGQIRLVGNDVEVIGDKSFSTSQLSQYIKQQPASSASGNFNPLLSIYNWGGRSDSWAARLCRKIGVAPEIYDRSLVDASKESIIKHLQYLGYYDSKVSAQENLKERKVKVKYIIELGHTYPVDSIRYDLPDNSDFVQEFQSDLANSLVRKGDFLSESVLESESVRSSALFRKIGYYSMDKDNWSFVADTLTNPGSVILEYKVRPYGRAESPETALPLAKYSFGEVNITHAADLPFRESVLKGMNLIKPGQPYSETVVNNTYSRFSGLKVFNSVNIEMVPVEGNKVDCNINLSESSVQGFKANVEASTNSTGLIGISPQLSFFHKNIFHGGEWLNLGFSGNFQFKHNDKNVRSNEFGVNASLSLPRFLGLSYKHFKGSYVPRTEFMASFNYQDRPEYIRNIFSLGYGYTGMFNSRLYYQLSPIKAHYVYLKDVDVDFLIKMLQNPYMLYSYMDHLDAGAEMMLYYSTNMDVVPKTSYWYNRLQLNLSGNILSLFNRWLPDYVDNEGSSKTVFSSPYSQYVRFEYNLGKTIRFGHNDRQSLAGRFVAGAGFAYGNSTALPYEKQFYSGGANSMRGWQARALGPGSSPMSDLFIIPSQTGDIKLELDMEYRFPLFWKFEGAIFAETGNVWKMPHGIDDEYESVFKKDFYKDLAADWGLGLRIDFSMLLVRLDFGMKLRDPSRAQKWLTPAQWLESDGFAFHFGVGYPF